MSPLTPPEEAALRALWQASDGSIKEVLQRLPVPHPPYTTLASTLRNLERKGYVRSEKVGNSYRFVALVAATDYQRRSLGALVQQHFQNSYKELVSFFAKEEKINADDLRDILRMINQHDANDPKS